MVIIKIQLEISLELLWELQGQFSATGVSLVAQRIKHLPAMQETWVRSLGWEDPLDSTSALISHTSKVMLKILQARLQQYVINM